MEKNNNHIDDLIGKYLAGEARPDESRLVESWVSEDPGNRKYFDHLKMIFDRAASITEVQQFDADAAWNKVKAKLTQGAKGKTIALRPQANHVSFYFRIAASVIIAAGIGFFAYRWFNPVVPTMQVATAETTQADTLPDGSTVFLNKKTQLAYEFDRKKETHVVKLSGEAYFEIQPEAEKKFIVQAEEVYIRDIGTSFNVTAYPETNTIEVVVEEGEVILYTESNAGINVQAGGRGVYDKLTKTFSLSKPEVNNTAYKTKFFSFTDRDLQAVINELNEVYPQRIRINDSIRNCRLTVTFKNEEPQEIANVIAETLGLRMKVSGQEILLEGSGCGE